MKRFFKHAGIALGCAALFYAIQMFASSAFLTGEAVGFGIQAGLSGGTLPDALLLSERITEAVLQAFWDWSDVVILLTYLLALALFTALLYGERPERPLGAARVVKPRGMAMFWAPAALGLLVFYAVQGGMMLIPEDAPLMEQYIEAASSLEMGRWPWLSFVVTVIGAPVVEELIFRGMIYRHLKKAMPRLGWLALVLQAVIFGAAHGQLLWAAFTFALAIVLGLLYDYFDSLWPCILTHLCFNAANYIPFPFEPDAVGWVILLLSALLLAAVVMLVLALYHRARPERFAAREV